MKSNPVFHLSSFKRWHTKPKPAMVYSIAMYQPQWHPSLAEAPCWKIGDEDGEWIRPRNFIPDDHDGKPDKKLLGQYFDALISLYTSREKEVNFWLRCHAKSQHIYLLCWCPYDKAAKRQLGDYGSFVCHSAAVGKVLRDKGYTVLRDKDRKDMVRV